MSDDSDNNSFNMTPNRPYLLRAIYDWIADNDLTPHVLVDATAAGVRVPPQTVRNGQVVLNLAMQAVADLDLGNEWISFKARFSGVSHVLNIPVGAVLAIYAQENGQGMMFAEDGSDSMPPPATPPHDGPASGNGGQSGTPDKAAKRATSHLKVIK